eukprot:TRINITY_DN231_c0_g1_i7.p1 TRINITY_DN231_c0_g1~~TRINITY_DN231_c0_g1_i7.p1  ORF type:complete len:206 (+),score=4.19 TRINITY_DN231_c0_g1_i7:52-669(+)
MIRRPPRSTLSSSSAASDVYKRQVSTQSTGANDPDMTPPIAFGRGSAYHKESLTALSPRDMRPVRQPTVRPRLKLSKLGRFRQHPRFPQEYRPELPFPRLLSTVQCSLPSRRGADPYSVRSHATWTPRVEMLSMSTGTPRNFQRRPSTSGPDKYGTTRKYIDTSFAGTVWDRSSDNDRMTAISPRKHHTPSVALFPPSDSVRVTT